MKDGQIAKIISWQGDLYIGRIIQRLGQKIVSIGMGEGGSFEGIALNEPCRVQVLKNGTKLTITDNE